MCYYALVFLCGTSCGGRFYMVPLAYDNGMVPRRGWGFPAPPQGRRPEDLDHRADERKPLFA